MTRRNKGGIHPLRPSDEELKILKEDISQLEKWELLYLTSEGKFLADFLKDNVEQIVEDWKNAIYTVDDDKLINFRYSLRSKIQTIKALLTRMEEAGELKVEQQRLLASLTPDGE